MARRGGRGRSPGRRNPIRSAVRTPATDQASGSPVGRSGLQARIGLAFGIVAMFALPLAYQWAFRPSSRPAGVEAVIPILELGGILAAAIALLLGRRARAAGDRSTGAVWAPRLGGAAIVGYMMTVVILVSRGG